MKNINLGMGAGVVWGSSADRSQRNNGNNFLVGGCVQCIRCLAADTGDLARKAKVLHCRHHPENSGGGVYQWGGVAHQCGEACQ